MHPVHFVWKQSDVSEINTLWFVPPQWLLGPFWQNFCALAPWHCSHTHQWLFAVSSAFDLCSGWRMCMDSYSWHWPGLEGTVRNNGETTWVSEKKNKTKQRTIIFSCNTSSTTLQSQHCSPFFFNIWCSIFPVQLLLFAGQVLPALAELAVPCWITAPCSVQDTLLPPVMTAARYREKAAHEGCRIVTLAGVQNSTVQGPEKPCLSCISQEKEKKVPSGLY